MNNNFNLIYGPIFSLNILSQNSEELTWLYTLTKQNFALSYSKGVLAVFKKLHQFTELDSR